MKIPSIPEHVGFDKIQRNLINENLNFKTMLISLEKDSELKTHTSPTDAFIYVLEGEAIFILEAEEFILNASDGMSFRANQAHSLKALSNFKMLLFR